MRLGCCVCDGKSLKYTKGGKEEKKGKQKDKVAGAGSGLSVLCPHRFRSLSLQSND